MAGGSATLAGTVKAAFASGSYVARTYTILSAAGGLSGGFSGLTTSNLPAGFAAILSYTATDAILNLTATLGEPSAPGGALGAGGLSVNQSECRQRAQQFLQQRRHAAAQLRDHLRAHRRQSRQRAQPAFRRSRDRGPAGRIPAEQPVPRDHARSVRRWPQRHRRRWRPGARLCAGARGAARGHRARLSPRCSRRRPKPRRASSSAGPRGAAATAAATAPPAIPRWSAATIFPPAPPDLPAGLDYHLPATRVVGFALAGGGTNWSLAQGLGGGKSDAFQAGVYGATRSGPAYLAAAFAFTNHWMSTDRFAFAGDHLTASFNAQRFGGRVESGYRFATRLRRSHALRRVPGAELPHAELQRDRCQRRRLRALLQLRAPATDTRSELGARFDRMLAFNPSAVLTLRARLAWAHDWVSDPTLGGGVPDAPGRELHRQRRDTGEELRARLRRHRASPRQRRHAARQVRRRVRRATRPPMPAPARCATHGDPGSAWSRQIAVSRNPLPQIR